MPLRLAILLVLAGLLTPALGDEPGGAWRPLPLVAGRKVAPGWVMVGWGGFAVDGGALRTEPDAKGMGLLLYAKEKFGDCQLRVVYRAKDAKANAGVFVRIDAGVLDRLADKGPAVTRGNDGSLPPEMVAKMREASEKESGAWYPVHHGYEVQICDTGDAYHRTGAVYSLAKAAPLPPPAGEWRTLVITLDGDKIAVDVDGKRVSNFDPSAADVPPAKVWHEPKREPKRPRAGYVGLQTHDPGDVVWFREVSVRPLPRTR